jgi:ribosomal protein S18 acetylase RimI-like enzyme
MSARETVVRPARVEDAEALHDLYVELAEDRLEALPASADEIRALLAELASDTSRRLLVAEVESGAIAGTVDVLINKNPTHGGRPWAVIENVVVSEALRRHGIGRDLMTEALRFAQVANCYKVQLHSGKQRAEAHAFYRTLGFDAISEGFKVYLDE